MGESSGMNEEAASVRRLVQWNQFWLALLVLGSLAWFASWQVRRFFADFEKLEVVWKADGSLSIYSGGDGPFVITHLVEARAIAPLPRRMAIIESGHVRLSKAEVDKLEWFAIRSGEPLAPRKAVAQSQIGVLYYKSRKTERAN
jgi:hypothetical protein